MLPSEKVPKMNSSGEQYRNKMLTYQLPKQDLALAYCKHVDKENIGSFEDFIAARNEIALDIGKFMVFNLNLFKNKFFFCTNMHRKRHIP